MSILMSRFDKVVSKEKDYRMKAEAEFNIRIPGGFLNLDFKWFCCTCD
jgi:hypothetical protein